MWFLMKALMCIDEIMDVNDERKHMFTKQKMWVQYQKMRLKWKKVNRHNFSYPGFYFDMKKVHIGNYIYGKINAHMSGCENEFLQIGNFCSIASSVKFMLAGEHDMGIFSTYPFKQKLMGSCVETKTKGRIVIQDDVWLGENVIVLSGVTIGQGAVVAAGAVVVKDVEPYTIVGGVPAKFIKKRFNDDIIDELLKIDYSKITPEMICNNINDLYEYVDSAERAENIREILM